MKFFIALIFFFSFKEISFAQKDTCEFILVDTASYTSGSTYFMASDINNWKPADSVFRFKKDKDNTQYLICTFDKGTRLHFKFTRGSWDNVECNADGSDIDNHEILADTVKVAVFNIRWWKDHFFKNGKPHTASSNVHLLNNDFYIPQLNQTRRIWIYLPDGYNSSNRHYPVLYMHDGQNLFDDYTSGYGEWGIDECLDTLIRKGLPPCIVVGIDCGTKRLNEYNPYSNERFGAGEGNQYVDFIVQTLKPFIDTHYKTLASKKNTLIAGSSMGGLISYYAILKYPDVFGKAGIFSPSFWVAPQMIDYTDSVGNKADGKIFFYIGGSEGDDPAVYVDQMNDMEKRLVSSSKKVQITSVVDPQSKHNEKAWRKWFPVFYEWIMKDEK